MRQFRTSAWSPAATRAIRTTLPPRPAITVITYLDHFGNPVKTKDETDISLIRTRENKFYLQRVFQDESVVRFLVPGLEMIKNAANFEYFSFQDIDVYGGVLIPAEVFPTSCHDRPGFGDAVWVMMKCKPTTKFTRKDRRAYHRRLFSHWTEDPEKYKMRYITLFANIALVGGYLLTRYIWGQERGIPFFGDNRNIREDDLWARAREFSDRHPEHLYNVSSTANFSPAMTDYAWNRIEIKAAENMDPTMQYEILWKMRHLQTYGHWPKGILQ